jgi:hypothetical protein
MKKFLVITILVLCGVLAGWITFARTPGRASFTIETDKMKSDAEEAIEKGKSLLRQEPDPQPDSPTEQNSPTT